MKLTLTWASQVFAQPVAPSVVVSSPIAVGDRYHERVAFTGERIGDHQRVQAGTQAIHERAVADGQPVGIGPGQLIGRGTAAHHHVRGANAYAALTGCRDHIDGKRAGSAIE